MIKVESVAPSTTPELPEIPMAHLKESHVSENDVPSNKCIASQKDAIDMTRNTTRVPNNYRTAIYTTFTAHVRLYGGGFND